MKMTMTKEFRQAVNAVEQGIYRYCIGVEWSEVIDLIDLYFEDKEFSAEEITGVILDHAFAEFHEDLDVEDVRKKIAKVIK